MTRSLIAKKEELVDESGVQIRNADPSSPVTNQLWTNTSTGRLKYYNGMVEELFEGYTEGGKPSQIKLIPSVNIDWSVGVVYKKVVNANISYTFSNVQDGKTIYVITQVELLTSSNISWPVGTKLRTGDNFSIVGGQGLVTQLTSVNGVVYAKNIFTANVTPWPSGDMGDLTILNGETVIVNSGDILDYNNVDIQAGGTLQIQGAGGITLLGVKNNLIINGQIVTFGALHGSQSFSVVTPNGESIGYSISQAQAGRGGAPSIMAGPAPGGSLGYGGGGNGGNGLDLPAVSGGSDGNPGSSRPTPPNTPQWGFPKPGGGGNVTLGAGGNGNGSGTTLDPFFGRGGAGGGSGGSPGGVTFPISGGGGGGGGYKGTHGRGLFIYCEGAISGAGTIRANGTNAFNGGNGGPDTSGQNLHSGGGGGGGAGGSGATVWVRKPSSNPFPSGVTVLTGGGSGASAGNVGSGGVQPVAAITPALPGNSGSNGSLNVADI